MTTGKTIALGRWTFVGKVRSLLLNMLSRLVITFLPRSKRLLISRLQSPSAVIFSVFFFFYCLCVFDFIGLILTTPLEKMYLAVILFNLGKSHYLLKNFFFNFMINLQNDFCPTYILEMGQNKVLR